MPNTIQPNQLSDSQRAHIVDVRSRDEFLREHIPDSNNMPLDRLGDHLDELRHMPDIILSCQSGKRAAQAAEQLQQLGIDDDKLKLLDGSLNGWKSANQPTRSLKGGISIMRQVQLIVGVMILIGLFVPSLWWVALIAGIGMLVAGTTGTCLMATVLAKLPWN
jgi:rhodanese-related sulfurtransferase